MNPQKKQNQSQDTNIVHDISSTPTIVDKKDKTKDRRIVWVILSGILIIHYVILTIFYSTQECSPSTICLNSIAWLILGVPLFPVLLMIGLRLKVLNERYKENRFFEIISRILVIPGAIVLLCLTCGYLAEIGSAVIYGSNPSLLTPMIMVAILIALDAITIYILFVRKNKLQSNKNDNNEAIDYPSDAPLT